jgi:hypothetical protein
VIVAADSIAADVYNPTVVMIDVEAKPLVLLMVIVPVEAIPPTVNVPALAVIDPDEMTDLLAVRSNATDKVLSKATAAVDVIAAVEYNPTVVMIDDEARPPVIVIVAEDATPTVVIVDELETPPTVNTPALAVIEPEIIALASEVRESTYVPPL